MTQFAGAIERFCVGQGNIDDRIDKLEEIAIGRFLVEIVNVIADRIPPAALHAVIVIVQHFLEWTAIDHCLIALETFPLIYIERLDRYLTNLYYYLLSP